MIRTEELTCSVGEFRLDCVSLNVVEGTYFVLLGPPGSGKTVFLECLCGLKPVADGRIVISGCDVTCLEPRKREVGYVPQDYALFPHLSVADNIGFGLRERRQSRRAIARRVAEKASLLGIEHLLKRRVDKLSGGEKQRTALARALAIEPKVLLLDEPVSALDESTRENVCAELLRLRDELGVTIVHVSHSLEEAFFVGDRGAVLRDGALEQVGTLDQLLRRPANAFVARFMRCGNLVTGTARGACSGDNHTCIEVQGIEFLVPGRHHGNVTFVIRPENVLLLPAGHSDAPTEAAHIPVKLDRVVDRGAYMHLALSGPIPLVSHMTHRSFAQLSVSLGDNLLATVSPETIHVLPRRDEEHA